MKYITFTFDRNEPLNNQERVLKEINNWKGDVIKASRLKPDAKHEELRRFCYAQVSEDVPTDRIIDRIKGLPGIESVEEPAERRLV